jgi:hypothetical protein
LNKINFRERYFGRFFTENNFFKERSKITEYGIGGVIMDRFTIEIGFYILFALLGLVLGGPKLVKKPKDQTKVEEPKKDEEKPN